MLENPQKNQRIHWSIFDSGGTDGKGKTKSALHVLLCVHVALLRMKKANSPVLNWKTKTFLSILGEVKIANK